MFRGFWKESVSYINPKSFWGWVKFFVRLPISWYKFQMLVSKDRAPGE